MPRRHKYKQEKLMTKLLKQKEKQATKKVNKTKPQKSASAKPSAPYTDQTEKDDIQNYGIVVFVTDITMTTIVMTMTGSYWWGCQTFFHEKRTGIWKQIRFETFYE